MEFKDYIVQTCNEMAKFLINKNKRYGNSVARPLHVFSWLPPEEQIKARIDDKIKRIRYGHRTGRKDREDTIRDLAGYLILLMSYKSYEKDIEKEEEREIRELVERAKKKELGVSDEPVRPYEYYVFCDGKYNSVLGVPIEFPGSKGYDLFLHRSVRGIGWSVSEGKTGMVISEGLPSGREAVESAKERLKELKDKKELEEQIKARINAHGPSPRYIKGEGR